MDNSPDDLRPDPETLVKLYLLRDRYGLVSASKLMPVSESDRHRLETGHRLAYGCCSEASESSSNLATSATA